MKLSHLHYINCITSLLDTKQVLIDTKNYELSNELDKFINKFIEENV